MDEFDPKTITQEKSLWAILANARRLPGNWVNRFCLGIAGAVILFYVILSNDAPGEFAGLVRSLANTGIGFAGAILGFLVAGFTIFATLSKPSLMIAMAKVEDKKSHTSVLKSSFGVFYLTFAWYLGFCIYCIIVLVFGAPGGPISSVISTLPTSIAINLSQIISRLALLIMGVWLVQLALELKSFMFNLYHVVMTSIRWMIEFPDDSDVNGRSSSLPAPKTEEKR